MGYDITPTQRDAILEHLRKDATLRPIIDRLPFPEERVQLSDPYPALLRSIIGQQVSIAAAASIYRKFLALFGLEPDGISAAPPPEVLAKAEAGKDKHDAGTLRSAGLSNAKAVYVKEIARYFLEHPDASERLRAMPDEDAKAELVQIKGVGEWTAEMMLMFALGRMDLLPLDDLAIYQTMIELYDLPPDDSKRALKKQMREIAEAWRPYRSVACLYLYSYRRESRGLGGFTV